MEAVGVPGDRRRVPLGVGLLSTAGLFTQRHLPARFGAVLSIGLGLWMLKDYSLAAWAASAATPRQRRSGCSQAFTSGVFELTCSREKVRRPTASARPAASASSPARRSHTAAL